MVPAFYVNERALRSWEQFAEPRITAEHGSLGTACRALLTLTDAYRYAMKVSHPEYSRWREVLSMQGAQE